MIDAISIAGSALDAQTISLAVTADNVANATTPGFTAKQAQLVAMNPGVWVGAIINTGQPVDLANQMVNLILAKTAYQAAASRLPHRQSDDQYAARRHLSGRLPA